MKRAHLPEHVEVGDIVRIPHFIGARNKQHWMYRLAVPVRPSAKTRYKCALADIEDLYELGHEGFTHLLDSVSWCEILCSKFPREIPAKVLIPEEKKE